MIPSIHSSTQCLTNSSFLPSFSSSSSKQTHARQTHPPAVLDVAGKQLRASLVQYILPAIIIGPDLAGGFTLSNDTCPPKIIQDEDEFQDGTRVIFTPLDLKKGVVWVSSDTNIRFVPLTEYCNDDSSLVWRVHELNALTGKYYVSVGGVEGNPGPQTLSNWFKIEPYESVYKLRFCPSVCKTCKVICRDVGIVKENGKRPLALSDVPFKVVFKAAYK